jgi:uncharacterized protein involved in response to NO
MLALDLAGWLPFLSYGLALHALTVGAMGGLILAMIARVSLGHTGRMIAPPKTMAFAFAFLNLGAACRVFLVPADYWHGIVLATVFWSVAFVLYLQHYAAMLCRPRLDGKPG